MVHDTTAVQVRKTARRMRTSGGTAKFECVHLGNIAAIARTKPGPGVFVSSKPLAFHGCGRGGVWDLTLHITCLASQYGQTGNGAHEEIDLCCNSVEQPVQVYLPPKIYHDALGFILQHLTPVAHERAEMRHDKQDELHHRLLRCGIRGQVPLDVVMLNEIEYDISTPLGEHWLGRNVYKWSPGTEDADIKTTCSGTVTTYSNWKQLLNKDISQTYFIVCLHMQMNVIIDEEWLRHLLCSSGTMDGARGLKNSDAWDLAIYLYTVTDTKHY